MQELSDGALIDRAKSGDAEAYGELVRRHQATAFRVAYLVTRSAADAEEATQDGFVRGWRALRRFRSGAAFRPWILHIVRNQARNAVRSRGRREAMHERALLQPRWDEPDTATTVAHRADAEALLDAIDRLPARQHDVIACLYLLELSESETATVLGVPRGTVKSRAARARRSLEEELDR